MQFKTVSRLFKKKVYLVFGKIGYFNVTQRTHITLRSTDLAYVYSFTLASLFEKYERTNQR